MSETFKPIPITIHEEGRPPVEVLRASPDGTIHVWGQKVANDPLLFDVIHCMAQRLAAADVTVEPVQKDDEGEPEVGETRIAFFNRDHIPLVVFGRDGKAIVCGEPTECPEVVYEALREWASSWRPT